VRCSQDLSPAPLMPGVYGDVEYMNPRRKFKMLLLPLLLSLGCSSGPAAPRGGSGGQGGTAAAGSNGQGGTGQAGSSGPGGTAGVDGLGGSVGAPGAGGSTGAAGTTGVGGSAAAGVSGGTSGGGAGQDAGTGSQDGGGETGPSAGPFTCNLFLGLFTTSQWFNGTNPGGASKTFLQQPGIDATKWEGKLQKYSYVEKWADPQNALWSLTTANPCATNPTTPDRVLFVAFSPDTKHDQPTFQALIEKVITNIKTKYPSAKEIDILTMGRAPGNVMCANNSDTDTVIGAYEDDAFQAIADASNGLIKVGPKYFVPDCQNSYIFANDTDYTTSAANSLAIQNATYYAAHP
jgi:hypothetical protein